MPAEQREKSVKIIDYTQTHIDDAYKLPISTYIN